MENKTSDQAYTAQQQTTANAIASFLKLLFLKKDILTVEDYIVQQDRTKFVNLVSLCTALGLLMGATNGYQEVCNVF